MPSLEIKRVFLPLFFHHLCVPLPMVSWSTNPTASHLLTLLLPTPGSGAGCALHCTGDTESQRLVKTSQIPKSHPNASHTALVIHVADSINFFFLLPFLLAPGERIESVVSEHIYEHPFGDECWDAAPPSACSLGCEHANTEARNISELFLQFPADFLQQDGSGVLRPRGREMPCPHPAQHRAAPRGSRGLRCSRGAAAGSGLSRDAAEPRSQPSDPPARWGRCRSGDARGWTRCAWPGGAGRTRGDVGLELGPGQRGAAMR